MTWRQTNRRGRFGSRSGNAMLEFAVGWFILTSAFTATFQYGYTFYQYNSLFNAVNAGARYGAFLDYDTSCSTPTTAFLTDIANMVVYGNEAGTGSAILRGLSTNNVNITVGGIGDCSAGTWAPSSVTITIGGHGTDMAGNAVTGYTINNVISTFTANGKPSATYPFQGSYQPY